KTKKPSQLANPTNNDKGRLRKEFARANQECGATEAYHRREQSSRDVWPPPAGCAARSSLRFWEIAANVSELSWSLQKPLLPFLPFFSACRWITEFVDLLTSQVNGLGRSFWASL